MYVLKDWLNKPIRGAFYQNELTAAAEPDEYKIDKILKKRTLKSGVKQVYVSFLGWGREHNQWMNADTVTSPPTK
jgi:hypothetical protein